MSPNSEPEAEAESNEPEPKGEAEWDVEPEPEIEGQQLHQGAEPEVEPGVEPENEPETELVGEWEPEPESEGETDATAESEPETEPEMEPGEAAIWVTLYSIFIVLILAGNILIIGVLLRNKRLKRSATNLFLLSLLVARACIAVFVVPARITGIFSEEYLGSAMCKLCHFCALGSSVSSVLSTVGVAFSKYLEVVRKRTDFNVKRTSVAIGVVWLISYSYAVRNLVLTDLTRLHADSSIISCTVDSDYDKANNVFTFVDIVCLFLAPFAVILFCYVKVIVNLNRSRKATVQTPNHANSDEKRPTPPPTKLAFVDSDKQVNDQHLEEVKVTAKNGHILQQQQKQQQETQLNITEDFLRNAKMLVTVTMLFTVCTSIPYIWALYVYWATTLPSNFQDIDRSVYLCSYANPWLNVFVFVYFRYDIRDGLRSICACGCSRKENKVCHVRT